MRPYYSDSFVEIYHADVFDYLQTQALSAHVLITDPVWPNAIAILAGANDPYGLFAKYWKQCSLPVRAAIHLGCASDPRFLSAVPSVFQFFRTVSLDLALPGRRGRLLMSGDTAYLFGPPPPVKPGKRLIPGRSLARSFGKETAHPCPRKLVHASWLVNWWSTPSDLIFDPFCGSGTTLLAAKEHGRKAIGVEVEEKYCEMAANRMGQICLALEI
jgi:DNA methylase